MAPAPTPRPACSARASASSPRPRAAAGARQGSLPPGLGYRRHVRAVQQILLPRRGSEVWSGGHALRSWGSLQRQAALLPPRRAPGAGSIAGGARRRFVGSVSASEVEQSEDYTCIVARGPNPKTTHIFGDCILESQTVRRGEAAVEGKDGAAKSYLVVKCAAPTASDAVEDFLSSCFTCKKKLEGNGIYIYRSEKAFCSAKCRDQEMVLEEEAENNIISIQSPWCQWLLPTLGSSES